MWRSQRGDTVDIWFYSTNKLRKKNPQTGLRSRPGRAGPEQQRPAEFRTDAALCWTGKPRGLGTLATEELFRENNEKGLESGVMKVFISARFRFRKVISFKVTQGTGK